MARITTTDYRDGDEFRRKKCAAKGTVLRHLKSFQPYAAAGGPFEDMVTGEDQWGKQFLAYSDNGWNWTSSEIYHLEKYDLELKPEFIEYVLSLQE